MAHLSPAQRHDLYRTEADRTGIHLPILAALYRVQGKPLLEAGETGLGISPVNRVRLDQVSSFGGQVHYAANTIRSITNNLTAEGWKGSDFWQADEGRYTDKFLQAIAAGYTPPASDTTAALLETSNRQALLDAYLAELAAEISGQPPDFTNLDEALLTLVRQVPTHYVGLSYQRDALLELVRLWRKLDTRAQAVASLSDRPIPPTGAASPTEPPDETALDPALLQAVQRLSSTYKGYPHQREALLRLTQLWQQLDSRAATIAALANNPDLATQPTQIDSALIAFSHRILPIYDGKGDQRNALVEGFRLWQGLDSRSDALIGLGVDADIFTGNPSQTDLTNAAIQIDRALVDFIRQIPLRYNRTESQRQALLHTVQLWQNLPSQEKAIQTLWDDLKRMERARRDTPDATPTPTPLVLPRQPEQWTPDNLQLYAPIIPNGSFTWAEATHGGMHLPPNQTTIDAIVHLAQLAQQARDRLGRPLHITRWYSPTTETVNRNDSAGDSLNHPERRHHFGDAIDFYCEGFTGDQLYWFLDPWWSGGLGRYSPFPYLCYIDAQRHRIRWLR